MLKHKVSVIIGIYNCAPTLVEALDSLYSQTFTDFDIVLCEDGSSDDTFKVAKKYAEQHDNIILIQNPHNLGLNATLNRCLELATGDYIARMDGDDISLPTRFEKEVKFLDEHPEYAIVSCPMVYFDESGEFGRGRGNGEPSKEVFISGTPFCHAPCMVRKEAYDKVCGYSVSPKLLRYEDYNLWMKMYAEGYRGYNLDECLYAMRDNRSAVKRRTLKNRFNGIYAHYLAHKELRLSWLGFVMFAVVSFAKGITPLPVYNWLHKRRFKK